MKMIAAIILAISVTACAGSGKINWNNARQVKLGMSEQQVTALLGRPYSVTAKPDGTQIWVWVNANGMTGSTSSIAIPMKGGVTTADLKVPDSF